MTGIFAYTNAHAEMSQDGKTGQASGSVDLAAYGGAVSVEATAGVGSPSLSTPQPAGMSADAWALFKS